MCLGRVRLAKQQQVDLREPINDQMKCTNEALEIFMGISLTNV